LAVLLKELDLTRCEECGKLFAKEPGKRLCLECAPPPPTGHDDTRRALEPGERAMIKEFAKLSGFSREVIEEQVRALPGRGSVLEGGPACVRCQTRPPMADNDLCVYCQLDLYRTLGDAAEDLFDRMEVLEPESTGPASVISAYEQKRRRTATSHINPSGAQWLKKYSNV
jgi:hypothetical protein